MITYFQRLGACFFVTIGIFLFSTVAWSDADRFNLLSDKENGVMYLKDPCTKNGFSLIFSFSQDIKDVDPALSLVELSQNFQDVLAMNYEELGGIHLEPEAPQIIGNRQVKIHFFAKKISEEGRGPELVLPDQIEVVFVEKDLSKISDSEGNHPNLLNSSDKIRTLINVNTETQCSE